jgi:CUB domain
MLTLCATNGFFCKLSARKFNTIEPCETGEVVAQIVTLDFLNFLTEGFVDTVYLYDGTTTSAPLIASLNGIETTTGWKSTQMYMLVRFSTNAQTVRPGWRAVYSSQAAP